MLPAFDHCDRDNTKTLSKDEAIACLEEAGVPEAYWGLIGKLLEPYLELPRHALKEIKKGLDKVFKEADTDKDKTVSEGEFRTWAGKAGMAKEEIDAIILAGHIAQ